MSILPKFSCSIHLKSNHFMRRMSMRSQMPLDLVAAIKTQIKPDSSSRPSNWLWNGPISAVNIEYKSHSTIKIGDRLALFQTNLRMRTINKSRKHSSEINTNILRMRHANRLFLYRSQHINLSIFTQWTIWRLPSAIKCRVHCRMWWEKSIEL